MTKKEQKTQAKMLYNKLQEKKKIIEAAEAGTYQTNGEFRFSSSGRIIDITTERNPNTLVEIGIFLKSRQQHENEVAKELGLENSGKWLGVPLEAFMNDIKVRATKITLASKKAELDKLEKGVLALSPELLQEIKAEALAAAVENL